MMMTIILPYLDDALELLHIQPLCFYQLCHDVPAETEEATGDDECFTLAGPGWFERNV